MACLLYWCHEVDQLILYMVPQLPALGRPPVNLLPLLLALQNQF